MMKHMNKNEKDTVNLYIIPEHKRINHHNGLWYMQKWIAVI